MIIPLINPHRSRNKIIAGKVLRHLKRDINEMRHEMAVHKVLIRKLRKVNPCGSNPKFKRPALLSRGFINPLSKESSMRFSLLGRRKTHKRRARRKHNPSFGIHRPTLLFGRGGWRRRPRSRLMRKGTRVNPRRRYFSRRRNPAIPFAIDRVALGGLKIAGGIAGGFLLKPIIAGFLPKDKTTGAPMFINFFGVLYIVGGAIAAAMIRQKDVKDIALILAGVGVYDLIASNLRMLGLPVLPYMKSQPALPAAGNEPGVIGSSYQQAGADFAPAMGSSYENAGVDDIAYGGDVLELD
jgi:hypothetical protein